MFRHGNLIRSACERVEQHMQTTKWNAKGGSCTNACVRFFFHGQKEEAGNGKESECIVLSDSLFHENNPDALVAAKRHEKKWERKHFQPTTERNMHSVYVCESFSPVTIAMMMMSQVHE